MHTIDGPVSERGPVTPAFFDDPYPEHERLREAGPVVWLRSLGCSGVARYAEVHAVFNDWPTYISSRGVGLQDFARETPWRSPSLVLERDPPEHTRPRAVLNRVLSPAAMKRLREDFAAAAERKVEELLDRRSFDAIPDLAEAFPLSVFPDALGVRQDGREHLLPFAAVTFNAFGPDNDLRRQALAGVAPHMAWVMEQCRRENLAPGGFGAG